MKNSTIALFVGEMSINILTRLRDAFLLEANGSRETGNVALCLGDRAYVA